jgi:CubicO group peptidase (beta-lactamase class C family)
LSRRSALTGAASVLALWPATGRAQARPDWDGVAEAARGLDQLHAVMIAHRGRIVLAEAFRGPPLNRAVNVKSVSKTLVAALTGAAIYRGEIAGVEATLGQIAPGLIPPGADPRVANLTVADLITMQAGLERTSGANYGSWVSSRNWVADALSRPFAAEPGSRMLYSTGSIHVLGAALAEATGMSLLAQARTRLGDPLSIEVPAWTRDPQGYYLGGNEMALTPEALLRFGEMYRQGGAWQGRQVLSRAWVQASFVTRTRSPWSGLGYGYGWFLGQSSGERFALARGYGGQVICVVPGLDLTAVITSDPTRPARSQGYFGDLLDLIADRVMPATSAV